MSFARSYYSRFTTVAAATAALAALAACSDSTPTSARANTDVVELAATPAATALHTVYGANVPLGHGHVRTYMLVDPARHNAPTELGIAFDESALDGLTQAIGEFPHLLPLPAHAPAPFKLVELDWNPQGHPPVGIYTKPHFDFHFYTISLAHRDHIDPADPQYMAKAANLPSAAYVPAGYVDGGTIAGAPQGVMAVPQMGLHWLNTRAAELPPTLAPFTSTFIYGSWDGQFIFQEPMVTRAFILSKKGEVDPAMRNQVIPVGVAQHYSPAGYHATAYRVGYDDATHQYRVALTHLAWGA